MRTSFEIRQLDNSVRKELEEIVSKIKSDPISDRWSVAFLTGAMQTPHVPMVELELIQNLIEHERLGMKNQSPYERVQTERRIQDLRFRMLDLMKTNSVITDDPPKPPSPEKLPKTIFNKEEIGKMTPKEGRKFGGFVYKEVNGVTVAATFLRSDCGKKVCLSIQRVYGDISKFPKIKELKIFDDQGQELLTVPSADNK